MPGWCRAGAGLEQTTLLANHHLVVKPTNLLINFKSLFGRLVPGWCRAGAGLVPGWCRAGARAGAGLLRFVFHDFCARHALCRQPLCLAPGLVSPLSHSNGAWHQTLAEHGCCLAQALLDSRSRGRDPWHHQVVELLSRGQGAWHQGLSQGCRMPGVSGIVFCHGPVAIGTRACLIAVAHQEHLAPSFVAAWLRLAPGLV